jgi:hypothetical protein
MSGNPSGRPAGSQNKVTLAAMALLEGQIELLTQKLVEKALSGDMAALKLCVERLIPPRRDRPVSIQLPPIKTAADIRTAYDTVAQAVSEGAVSPADAKLISDVLEKHAEAVDRADMAVRLEELEKHVYKK